MATKPLNGIFGTSASLETEGIWIDYGEYGRIKVARAGGKNKAFKNLMERSLRPYRSAMNMGTMDDAVLERITRENFAEAVVLDWDIVEEGPIDETTGKPTLVPVPFSREACVKIFEALPDLFLDIMQQAQTVVNFVEASREIDAKG